MRVLPLSVSPWPTPDSVTSGAAVSSTKLPLATMAVLPAASRALIRYRCSASAVPSSANDVLKLKRPSASSVSAVAGRPSMLIEAAATPDRLSRIWPTNVTLLLVASGTVSSTTRGACVSCVSAKRASTALATWEPSWRPALLSKL